MPMEHEPAWLSAAGRRCFGTVPSLEQLRREYPTGEAVAAAIAALGIQEGHATRSRAYIRRFLRFVEQALRRGVRKRSVGSWMVAFGGQLVQDARVRRSSTVRTALVGASRPWPSAMRSQEVRGFLRGLEVVSPVLPAAAGISLSRTVDEVRLVQWMRDKSRWYDGFPLALTVGLRAGLRLRETARILVHRGWLGLSVSEEGVARWREAAQLKQNARGRRVMADRVATVPRECVSAVRALDLPWKASEAYVERVVRETSRSLAAAGVARDVRAFRRTMAVRVREHAAAAGADEREAIRWAQRALSHKENGDVIVRYLPSLLSARGSSFLEQAQIAGTS